MATNELVNERNIEKQSNESTRYQIIKTALKFIATKTYNSFSINDIAKELKLTKSSIYYHFNSKEEIGLEALKLRRMRIEKNMMDQKKRNPAPPIKMREFFNYFLLVNDINICPGASLSVDYKNIPKSMQEELTEIFKEIIKYLEEILIEGRDKGMFFFKESTYDKAELLFSVVEGTILVARSMQDDALYNKMTEQILFSLTKN